MNPQLQPNNPFAGAVMRAAGNSPVAAGAYYADLVSVSQAPDHPKFGGKIKLKWVWKVATGPQQGRTLDAITDWDFSPANRAGRFVAGTIGRQPALGEDLTAVGLEVMSYIGKRYLVTQGKGPKSDALSVQAVTIPPPV